MNNALMEDITQVLENADCLYDEQAVANALDAMAEQLNKRLQTVHDPLYLCVMNGGFYTTAQLMQRIQQPAAQFDYLQASRYHGEISASEIAWKAMPSLPLDGRTIVLIDDIYDEGITLKQIIKALQSQGVVEIIVCVLTQKKHNRNYGQVKLDIVGLELPDRYVFGCGMDYKHYHRHLNAIYAIKDN